MMVGHLFFLLENDAVEFIGQQIDRGIHVWRDGIGEKGFSGGMEGGFGFVIEF